MSAPAAAPPLRQRLTQATLWTAGGQVLTQGASFARNVIVARAVTPEHFGIASTFALTVALVEMSSGLSTDRLLVQARDGDRPELQRTAQLFELARGAACALLIFALAGPLAAAFGAQESAWAFRWLALVPLAHGLMHLDPKRVQRELRFAPGAASEAVPAIVSALAAWPVAFQLRDYSAMLWLLLAQAALQGVLTHVVAKRSYGLAWDRAQARRIAAFGWPLLVNGILMFGITQGDRMVIGTAGQLFGRSAFTLADLGVYSVAFGLTQIPALVAAQVSGSVLLPLFAHASSPAELSRRYALGGAATSLVAGAFALLFLLSGPALVVAIYGPSYASAGSFIGCLGLMQAVRIVRSVPTHAAIAGADTRAPMLANLLRSVALVGVIFSAWAGLGMLAIALCGLGGELLAESYVLRRVQRQRGLSARACLLPHALVLPALGGAAFAAAALPESAWLARAAATLGFGIVLAGSLLAGSRELRELVRGRVASDAAALPRAGHP